MGGRCNRKGLVFMGTVPEGTGRCVPVESVGLMFHERSQAIRSGGGGDTHYFNCLPVLVHFFVTPTVVQYTP